MRISHSHLDSSIIITIHLSYLQKIPISKAFALRINCKEIFPSMKSKFNFYIVRGISTIPPQVFIKKKNTKIIINGSITENK